MKLVVYTGGMRSGKSDALITQAERLQIAGLDHIVIKHRMDNERVEDIADQDYILSRSGRKIECVSVSTREEVREIMIGHDNILIDEIQFFDSVLYIDIKNMLRQGKNIWVSGLDMDFRGISFGNVESLCGIADEIIKLKSVCSCCGSFDGKFSYLKGAISKRGQQSRIHVGDEEYQSLCAKCYYEKTDEEYEELRLLKFSELEDKEVKK